MQLGKTKAIKHSGGVVVYFRSHLSPNLSHWKEGNHDFYLWLQVSMGAALDLFVCVVYVAPIGSKHKNESLFQNLTSNIVKVQTIGGIILLGGILMCVLQSYQIPLTLMIFVNCYRHLNSLRLNNQMMWLSGTTPTPMLAAGATSSWTYVVTLGCSSLMADTW
jgi:hypothetical protein